MKGQAEALITLALLLALLWIGGCTIGSGLKAGMSGLLIQSEARYR